MTSRNEVTGKMIVVGAEPDSKLYDEGWDRIFGKKKKKEDVMETNNGFSFTPCKECPPDAICKSPFCKNLIKFNDAYTREDEDWFFHPNDD